MEFASVVSCNAIMAQGHLGDTYYLESYLERERALNSHFELLMNDRVLENHPQILSEPKSCKRCPRKEIDRKIFMTKKLQACLVSVPIHKELRSHHSHPQKEKKSTQNQ